MNILEVERRRVDGVRNRRHFLLYYLLHGDNLRTYINGKNRRKEDKIMRILLIEFILKITVDVYSLRMSCEVLFSFFLSSYT